MAWQTMMALGVAALLGCVGLTLLAYRRWQQYLLLQNAWVSVGYVAAGVSHDTNNLLTCINAYVDRLRTGTTPEAHRQTLEGIAELCRCAIRVNQQPLRMIRPDDRQHRCRDAIGQLSESRALLEAAIGGSATLNLDVVGERVEIPLSPGQLDQVLINLVINARDASAAEIDVIARVVPYLHRGTSEAILVIDVRDDGDGISPKVHRRARQAFSSSQLPARTLGLGVPTADRLARQAGGELHMNGVQGLGTTATITLPCVRLGDAGRNPPRSDRGKGRVAPPSPDLQRRAC